MACVTETLDINFGTGYLNVKYKEADLSADFTVGVCLQYAGHLAHQSGAKDETFP